MPDRDLMNFPYNQDGPHPMQFSTIPPPADSYQQHPKVAGPPETSMMPPDPGSMAASAAPVPGPSSMRPNAWPAHDRNHIIRRTRSSVGSVGGVSWDNEMDPIAQAPIINVPHSRPRICPFAQYNPFKYNKSEWPHCHNPQEKNGDIVVHLQRHHRLIRSQRKADKTGRKNGNGQSYIAICSGENFDERGDSQCHECDAFERIVDSVPDRKGDWNSNHHRISAICQKCWCILHDRNELAHHLQTNCGGRAPKHQEKWQLEYEAFCLNPDWIEPPPPNTQSPVVASPTSEVHSSITVPLRSHGDQQDSITKPSLRGYDNDMITDQYKSEIRKLRLHLFFLANHPTTHVAQAIQHMYIEQNAYDVDLSPPQKWDQRIEPPNFSWAPPYTQVMQQQPPPPPDYMQTMGPSDSSTGYMSQQMPPPGH